MDPERISVSGTVTVTFRDDALFRAVIEEGLRANAERLAFVERLTGLRVEANDPRAD